jgi:hypothetical protein
MKALMPKRSRLCSMQVKDKFIIISCTHEVYYYMLCYNVFPYFRPMVEYSTMVGASASVLAIVMAVAYREPDYRVSLLLIGSIRLKYICCCIVRFVVYHLQQCGWAYCSLGWSFGRALLCYWSKYSNPSVRALLTNQKLLV